MYIVSDNSIHHLFLIQKLAHTGSYIRALTTFKLEGEVEDNREKWGDFWEKLKFAINQNIVSRPL
jgi:hypothetical protein